MRICFDLSHTKLACNKLQLDFKAIEILHPITAHYHIADANKDNGEGFKSHVVETLCATNLAIFEPDGLENISWIPEVWQGHKDKWCSVCKSIFIVGEI